MKRKLVLMAISILTYSSYSQEEKIDPLKVSLTTDYSQEEKIDTLKVSLSTDINFSSSANDSRKESSSGIGTLGLKFKRGYIHGDVNFTVFSQNKELTSADSLETKTFGTNLLLPQNSSSKISNFSISLGVKAFFLKNGYADDTPTFSFKRFGANVGFRVNNNVWIKDSLSSNVTINTFEANLTYTLINARVFNSKEDIKVILSYGITTRRLGGDFALDSNQEMRTKFINTDKLGFNGTNLACRLEISKFYGQMNLTSFTKKDNIAGFSGNQAIITLGLTADLTLNAKEKDLKEQRIKELEEKVEELIEKK